MKNLQKDTSIVILLVVIIVVLLGVITYSYLKLVQNHQVQNDVINNQPIKQSEQNIRVPVENQIKKTTVIKTIKPSYDLMATILLNLGVNSADLTNSILEWNTDKTKINYSGYSFVIIHSSSENLQIQQTWKNTGLLDKLDVRSRFVNELKTKGFIEDWNNSGDGTFVGSSGYVKDNIVCIIKDKITTPPEQISDNSGYSSISTIICADKK